MEQKNIFLAFVLSLAVLLAWSTLFPQPPAEKAQTVQQEVSSKTPTLSERGEAAMPPGDLVPLASSPAPASSAQPSTTDPYKYAIITGFSAKTSGNSDSKHGNNCSSLGVSASEHCAMASSEWYGW